MPPAAKKAKTSKSLLGGSSKSSLEGDDTTAAAHELIDLAKSGKWQEVFCRLDAKRELVNLRPAVREYGVLHQAAFHGDAEVINTLIKKYGADPASRTKSGQSVLEVAEEQGHVHITASLSAPVSELASSSSAAPSVAKAVVPVPSLTPELIASAHKLIDHAKAGRWQEIYHMLDCQKELVNIRPDVREFSALHQAAYHDNKDALVTLITKYGADPHMQTASGSTLLQVAKAQGCTTVIESICSFLGEKVASKAVEVPLSGSMDDDDDDDPDLEMKQMADGSWKVVQKSASSAQLEADVPPPAEILQSGKRDSSGVLVSETSAAKESMSKPLRASGSSSLPVSAAASKKSDYPVDEYFRESESCQVYCDEEATWHCMLKRGNQFYVMQLLEISLESFCVWSRWGKIETEGQSDASYFVSPELAIAAFKSKFYEKTNNKWENRRAFKQFFAKFTYTPEPGLDKHASVPALAVPIPVPVLTAESTQQAHKLIDLAKAGRWADLFKMLETHKSLVNVRPEVREYSILHQAAFQGACDVSLRLVDQCGADPSQSTKFGKSAAVIAEDHGHMQLAEKLKERMAKHVSVAGG